LLGLRWEENVDLNRRVVRVQQQLQDGELTRTKRPRSVRTLPMASFLYDALIDQQAKQELARKGAGDDW
jgi:hypothetical protein